MIRPQPIAQLHQIDLLVMLAVPIVAMRVQLVAAVDEFLNRVAAAMSP
jgi:Flp pilus assembly pilin Flp